MGIIRDEDRQAYAKKTDDVQFFKDNISRIRKAVKEAARTKVRESGKADRVYASITVHDNMPAYGPEATQYLTEEVTKLEPEKTQQVSISSGGDEYDLGWISITVTYDPPLT